MADRAERPTHLRVLPRVVPALEPLSPGMLAPFRRGVKPSANPPALVVHAYHEAEFRQLMVEARLCASRVVWCADLTSTHVVRDVFQHHGRSVIVITVGVAALEDGEWEAAR